MQGKQHAILFRLGELLFEEADERLLAEDGGVDDFAGQQRDLFLENGGGAVGGDELNLRGGGLANRH